MQTGQSRKDKVIELVRTAQRFPHGSGEFSYAAGEVIVASQPTIKQMTHRIDRERDPDDVFQEVGLRIFLHLHGLEAASFIAWLGRVTLTVCMGMRRKRKQERECQFDNAPRLREKAEAAGYLEPIPEDQVVDPYNLEQNIIDRMYLAQLYGNLQDAQRQLHYLRFIQGYSLNEVAVMLYLPRGTVSSQIHFLKIDLTCRFLELERRPTQARQGRD